MASVKLNKLYKNTALFIIALIISITSLSVLIIPSAKAYPGELDPSFNVQLSDDWYWHAVYATAVQTDGKILVGGTFTLYNGTSQNYLIRLNADYSKDTSFDVGNSFNSVINDIELQTDGKIILGGYFYEYNGSNQDRIIRLNSDGTKDTSFDIGTGFDNEVTDLAIQSDGKILAVGDLTEFNGYSVDYQEKIFRLNTDGTLDTSFNATTDLYRGQSAYSVAVQPDGKILVGGDIEEYDSGDHYGLIRLNPDGSKDTSFNVGTGFDRQVEHIALQPDGKILVGGLFRVYNGVDQNRFIRLNPDGTKDTSFDIGTGFSYETTWGRVNSILVQSDGKIIAGGLFDTFNGATENNLLRLNPDGTKDTSFNVGTGFNDDQVESNMIQVGAAIIIGGRFTTYNGTPASNIARIQITNDKDQDGKDDSIEDSAPNSGDGNQDGTKDSLQSNVSSYTNSVNNQPITLEVNNTCNLSGTSTKPMSTNPTQDTNYSYPLGLYDFTASCTAPGHTTTFKAYYYSADTTKNYSLRKYNPNTNTYTTIDNASFSIETIDNQSVLTASYTITDGSSLDTDGLVNGTIVDPAGPALASTTTTNTNNTNNTNTPTAPNTGVGLSSDSNRQAKIQTTTQALISLLISLNITILAIVYIYRNRLEQ